MKSILLFFGVVAADQATKFAALNWLERGANVDVIDNLFSLTLVLNPGAAFGLFSGLSSPVRQIALGAVAVVAFGVIIQLYRESKGDSFSQMALVAILGGALGNIIDRFRFDAVVDFLDFYWGEYHWPAFNVADSAISIGVSVIIFRLLLVHRQHDQVEED